VIEKNDELENKLNDEIVKKRDENLKIQLFGKLHE
jgi:hypothetical protein